MKHEFVSKMDEARAFESRIENPVERAFVTWAINRAALRPTNERDFPEGNFDMLFFANLMLEFCRKREVMQTIFDGRADELW
jgi:hypothetical protein